MTIPRMEAISKVWEVNPPASTVLRMIAAALGAKFDSPKKTSDMGDLVALLGGTPGFAVKGGNG